MAGVLAIGNIYLDINSYHVPFGREGLIPEKEPVSDSYVIEPGGSALNFARQCELLEMPSQFIGKTGLDPASDLLKQMVAGWKTKLELVEDKAVSTNLGICFTNSEGLMISTSNGTANQALTPAEVLAKALPLLKEIDYLYIGGVFKLPELVPAFKELVEKARTDNFKVVFDHNRLTVNVADQLKEEVRQLALKADYYLPSRAEFEQLWRYPSLEEGLRHLQTKAKGQVVIKDGGSGALFSQQEDVVKVPAFSVDLLHSVGAGDCFNAGFIAGINDGLDTYSAVRFGCATAALKISQPKLPTLQAVNELIKA